MLEAEVVKETEKAYLVKPLNFEYNEGDLFIPKTAVDNWIVAQWLCARRRLDGGLTLLLPDGGVKGIEKIGLWDEDPAGNNGGAKVTNDNLESTPVNAEAELDAEIEVEIGDEDAGTREIDELSDIDGDGEPEPGKEEEQKDPFGPRVQAEEERIKQEQGLASKDEQPAQEKEVEDTGRTVPPEVEEQIEEIAAVIEKSTERAQKSVKKLFNEQALSEYEKANISQDIGATIAIRVLRGY